MLLFFLAYSYSTGTPASSRVTYFILRAYTGTMCWLWPTQEKLEVLEGKKTGEWTGRVEIGKEKIPCNKLSMYGYILTYSRL